MAQPESVASTRGFWRQLHHAEIINDHEITFHMNNPALTMVHVASGGFSGSEMYIWSKAHFDAEGLEGLDKRAVGTNYYQQVSRNIGENVLWERVPYQHWRAMPEFEELEMRFVREEATRMAMLIAGELDAASLSRDLIAEAEGRCMKAISAQVANAWLSIYLGGMYFLPGDTDFDPNTAWVDPKVRQAMNVALNREELNEFVLAGEGEPMYLTGYHANYESWNPRWQEGFEEKYGYNPDKAKQLMTEAGYGPDNLAKITVLNYRQSGEPEASVLAEALPQYWTRELWFDVTLLDLDPSAASQTWRSKKAAGAVWANVVAGWPIQEWIRQNTSDQSTSHRFEDEFTDQKYQEIVSTADPAEVDRLGREVGDYYYDNFWDVPLWWFRFQITTNPDVIEDWTFSGLLSGRTGDWHTIKSAKK